MFKALFKLVILLIVLVAVGGFFLGWWGAGAPLPDSGAVATAGQTGAEMAKRAGRRFHRRRRRWPRRRRTRSATVR